MSLVTNVVRRGGSYYFRVRVPKRLIAKVRPRELWRSLRTSDPSTARQRAGSLMALTEKLWSALDREMSVEVINALIDEWLRQNLEEDAQAREGLSRRPFRYAIIRGSPMEREFVRGLEPHEIPDPKDYPSGLVPLPNVPLAADEAFAHNVGRSYPHDQRQWMRLLGADEALCRRDIGLVEADVSSLLESKGIRLDPESDEFFEACLSMLRARAELAREVRERAETNWRPKRREAEPSPVVQAGAITSRKQIGITLSEGAKSFVPQAARDVTPVSHPAITRVLG